MNGVELISGILLATLGIAVAVVAPGYGLGTLMQTGAGALPLLLGIALIATGVVVAVEGLTLRTEVPPIPWKALLAISAGLAAFALLIETAGIYVATPVLIALAAFADWSYRPKAQLGIAVALCAFVALLLWAFGGSLVLPVFPFLE